MRRDPGVILSDAIATGEDIVAMIGGMSEAEFVADRKTQRATERSFEIIGEALARLARDFPELSERIPDHRRVIDFRNVLAHGYDVVDPRLVLDLAKTRLPGLLAALRAAL
jgi:uncharacterized protein with HEPN domain